MAEPDIYQSPARYLELICHLASYSPLLLAVSYPRPDVVMDLANAVTRQYREVSDVVRIPASDLGSSAVLTALLASRLGLTSLPADEVAARQDLLDAAQRRSEQQDPLLVMVEQAEQLSDAMLLTLGQLALMSRHTISFCLFGLTGFDRRLKEGPTVAPVYRIQLTEIGADVADGEWGSEPAQNVSLTDAVDLESDPDFAGLDLLVDDADMEVASPDGFAAAEPASSQSSGRDSCSGKGRAGRVNNGKAKSGKGFVLPSLKALNAGQLLASLRARLKGAGGVLLMVTAALLVTVIIIGSLYSDDVDEPVAVTRLPFPDTVRETTSSDDVLVGSARVADNADQRDSTGLSLSSSSTVAKTPQSTTPATRSPQADVPVSAGARQTSPVASESEADSANNASNSPSTAANTTDTVSKDAQEAESPRSSALPTWLSAGDGWSVQLIGTTERSGAEAYVERWRRAGDGRLVWFETRRNGAPWFVVVAGVFESRGEATQWAASLPAAMKSGAPWIRETAAIKSGFSL